MDPKHLHFHANECATDTPTAPGTEKQAEVRNSHGRLIATIALHGTAKDDNEIARLLAAAPKLMVLLESLTFIAESVAHLSNRAHEILPTTDAARELIAKIKGE